jgi:peptidoglycan/LPS O-acetylase OafA/YrhL
MSIGSGSIPADTKKKISFDMKNRILTRLRIDPGEKAGTYRIYEVTLHSFFGKKITLKPAEETVKLIAGPGVSLSRHARYVEITTEGEDPYLVIDRHLESANFFIKYILPFLAACLVLLGLRGFQPGRLYCFSDIHNKLPSSGINYDALDGLRGLAAILVLGDHSGSPLFKGLGAIGVLIFFSLSGFLLSIPFVKDPSRITSFEYITEYFKRRLKRILPMFYFFIIINYLFRGKYDSFLRHLFFLQGDGFLWTIPQEIYFYMILPVILLINFLLLKKSPLLSLVFLLGTAVFLNQTGDDWLKFMYGNGRMLQLWAGVFLNGVFISFLVHYPPFQQLPRITKIANSTIISLLFWAILFFPGQVLGLFLEQKKDFTWEHFGSISYITSILLLVIVAGPRSLFARTMRFVPLRAVGLVGYSFYIMHTTGLSLVEKFFENYLSVKMPEFTLFLMALFLTYTMAAITYTLIERPFLKKKIVSR